MPHDWKKEPLHFVPVRDAAGYVAADAEAQEAADSNEDKGHSATIFVGKVPGTTAEVWAIRVGGNRAAPDAITVPVGKDATPTIVSFRYKRTVNTNAKAKSAAKAATALNITF